MQCGLKPFELACVCTELQCYVGGSVKNISPLVPEGIILSFISKNVKESKTKLLLQPAGRIHITRYQLQSQKHQTQNSKSKEPASTWFASLLKQHLKNTKIIAITHHNFTTLVIFTFQRHPLTNRYHIIVDTSTKGNILFTNSEFRVINGLRRSKLREYISSLNFKSSGIIIPELNNLITSFDEKKAMNNFQNCEDIVLQEPSVDIDPSWIVKLPESQGIFLIHPDSEIDEYCRVLFQCVSNLDLSATKRQKQITYSTLLRQLVPSVSVNVAFALVKDFANKPFPIDCFKQTCNAQNLTYILENSDILKSINILQNGLKLLFTFLKSIQNGHRIWTMCIGEELNEEQTWTGFYPYYFHSEVSNSMVFKITKFMPSFNDALDFSFTDKEIKKQTRDFLKRRRKLELKLEKAVSNVDNLKSNLIKKQTTLIDMADVIYEKKTDIEKLFYSLNSALNISKDWKTILSDIKESADLNNHIAKMVSSIDFKNNIVHCILSENKDLLVPLNFTISVDANIRNIHQNRKTIEEKERKAAIHAESVRDIFIKKHNKELEKLDLEQQHYQVRRLIPLQWFQSSPYFYVHTTDCTILALSSESQEQLLSKIKKHSSPTDIIFGVTRKDINNKDKLTHDQETMITSITTSSHLILVKFLGCPEEKVSEMVVKSIRYLQEFALCTCRAYWNDKESRQCKWYHFHYQLKDLHLELNESTVTGIKYNGIIPRSQEITIATPALALLLQFRKAPDNVENVILDKIENNESINEKPLQEQNKEKLEFSDDSDTNLGSTSNRTENFESKVNLNDTEIDRELKEKMNNNVSEFRFNDSVSCTVHETDPEMDKCHLIDHNRTNVVVSNNELILDELEIDRLRMELENKSFKNAKLKKAALQAFDRKYIPKNFVEVKSNEAEKAAKRKEKKNAKINLKQEAAKRKLAVNTKRIEKKNNKLTYEQIKFASFQDDINTRLILNDFRSMRDENTELAELLIVPYSLLISSASWYNEHSKESIFPGAKYLKLLPGSQQKSGSIAKMAAFHLRKKLNNLELPLWDSIPDTELIRILPKGSILSVGSNAAYIAQQTLIKKTNKQAKKLTSASK